MREFYLLPLSTVYKTNYLGTVWYFNGYESASPCQGFSFSIHTMVVVTQISQAFEKEIETSLNTSLGRRGHL